MCSSSFNADSEHDFARWEKSEFVTGIFSHTKQLVLA